METHGAPPTETKPSKLGQMRLQCVEGKQTTPVASKFIDPLDQGSVILSQQFGQSLAELGVGAAEDEVGQIDDRCAAAGDLPVQESELFRLVDVLEFGVGNLELGYVNH